MIHITIVKVLDYLGAVVCILVGLGLGGVSIVGAGAVGLSGEQGSGIGAILFGSLGIVIGVFCLAIGIINIIAANALGNFKPWARWYHVVIGVMNVLNGGGILIGAYLLYVFLLNPEVKNLFENKL
jgi:hypothetical protein